MSIIDWLVLVLTLIGIIVYGVWKSRRIQTLEGYLLADRQMPWYHVGLSVMATQASAITFLSAPGQAFTDGMGFVQFYLGLPLAMIVLCITFVPQFHKLNVYTAYEYLENRFNGSTRFLTAFLFLLQRGISTGITIYAPALVLSTILGLPIQWTIVFMSVLVIGYTVYGGTKAVSHTQLLQMCIIFSGLFLAMFLIIQKLPEGVGVLQSLQIAGDVGKMNALDTKFDLDNKYNIWSGLIGGLFLQLSYFGTDQSQVGRYLTAKSIDESRWGLVMNGLLKIPMQFFILFIGIFVYCFYLFQPAPLFFNKVQEEKVLTSTYGPQYKQVQDAYELRLHERALLSKARVNNADIDVKQSLVKVQGEIDSLRIEAKGIIAKQDPLNAKDDNYIFLRFVLDNLPIGIVGLLMAIIFLAAMGSTASGLNALASTTMVDFVRRLRKKDDQSEKSMVAQSRWLTIIWGVFCTVVALYAGQLGNLIEVVNILGSLFYGTILGIFIVAFYMKFVKGTAVFWGAIVAELMVVFIWWVDWVSYLWLNVIGCLLVMVISGLIQRFENKAMKGY